MDEKNILTLQAPDYQFIKQVEPDWRKLLTCMQCGTCSASCPAAEWMDRSPRQVWQLIRLGLKDEVKNSRTFWLCTQCYACTARCPRGIITSETMRNLREWAVREGLNVPEALFTMRDAVKNNYNILNEKNETRLIWSQSMEPVPQQLTKAKRKDIEVLLYTGCVAAFFPMVYSIPQSFVQTLEQAGITYTALGGQEWCCGYPLYGAGMEKEVARLAEHNVKKAKAVGAKRMVITCPSCYHTWKHLYPKYVDEVGVEILHASEFLAASIQEGRIKIKGLDWVVTYHDPCDLGRKNEVYDAPRAVIQSIPGLTLNEMPHNRENALCCGGGGDVAMTEAQVSEEIAKRRLAEAASTGASAIISSCQQCKRTLLQAARNTKTRMRVLDVAELVWQAAEKGES